MSGDAWRLSRRPKNPEMAGGRDAKDIRVETWRCGPPPGKYPGDLPRGLLPRARRHYFQPGPVLVPFAGKLRIRGGVHVDLDPETQPDILGDVAELPDLVGGKLYDNIFADPPYGEEYAKALYRTASKVREGTDGKPYRPDGSPYTPHRWLVAMAKCLKPGGVLVYVDQLVPYGPRGTTCIARHPVLAGSNMRVRCVSVFRKGRSTTRGIEAFGSVGA